MGRDSPFGAYLTETYLSDVPKTPLKIPIFPIFKVSSSVPVAYRNILEIDYEKATDGGVADSIPVIEAYRRGASDITVVRTRPADYVKKRSRTVFLYSAWFRAYPGFVNAMKNRHDKYMQAVSFIGNPPEGVQIREIAPPADLATRRTTRDVNVLGAAYQCGIECGKRFVDGM
jgi:predicted patatin/cPLA2 family phospholipase